MASASSSSPTLTMEVQQHYCCSRKSQTPLDASKLSWHARRWIREASPDQANNDDDPLIAEVQVLTDADCRSPSLYELLGIKMGCYVHVSHCLNRKIYEEKLRDPDRENPQYEYEYRYDYLYESTTALSREDAVKAEAQAFRAWLDQHSNITVREALDMGMFVSTRMRQPEHAQRRYVDVCREEPGEPNLGLYGWYRRNAPVNLLSHPAFVDMCRLHADIEAE
ncbi:hypothetical protein MMC34_008537 [Xylographa carneopallida]|nr:hypothetical protein [Xylographa carneopallida]